MTATTTGEDHKATPEERAAALTMDPTRSEIVMMFGTKGRGKSAAARVIFDAWPADRIVIDPTGNARPDDPATIAYAAPFPSQLPDPDPQTDPPQTRVTVWARLNPASPTLQQDQDAAVSMALHPRHRRKLIWRDEFGIGTSAHRTGNHDQALLLSSRHYHTSALLVAQRPRHIPKVAIQQADKILIFHLPSPDDRVYVAKEGGIKIAKLERWYRANQERKSRHSFLLFDRETGLLIDCPELPNITAHGPKA